MSPSVHQTLPQNVIVVVVVVNTTFITAMKRFVVNSQTLLLVGAYLWPSRPAAGLSLGMATERSIYWLHF